MAVRRSKIWGAIKPDGTWIGALGLVNRSELDICISGVRWENDRYGAFEQTTEGFYVRYGVWMLFKFRILWSDELIVSASNVLGFCWYSDIHGPLTQRKFF